MRLAFGSGLLLAAMVIAGCAAIGGPTSAPALTTSPAPTAASVSLAPTPPSTPAASPATLTIEQGVEADGPGNSITEALAYRGSDSQLVNGTLLRDANGRIWLCETVVESPPQCPEPRLLVTNWAPAPDDGTFVSGPGLHVADGARWVERVQLYGFVRPGAPG
jgi:ABC-type transport system substrate-binding protein